MMALPKALKITALMFGATLTLAGCGVGKQDPHEDNGMTTYEEINENEDAVSRFQRIANDAKSNDSDDDEFALMLYQSSCPHCQEIEETVVNNVDPNNDEQEVVAMDVESFVPNELIQTSDIDITQFQDESGALYVPLIIHYKESDDESSVTHFDVTDHKQGVLKDKDVREFFQDFYGENESKENAE